MTEDVYMQLIYNVHTGNKVIVDPVKSRMGRMKRRIFSWAESVDQFYDESKHRMVMVTLTYRPDVEWEANQIRDFLQTVRRHVKNDMLAYAWVAENHESGRIHYHIYYVVNRGADIPMPDKSGMWSYGSSRIETGRHPFYLVSYLKKEYQKNFAAMPKGLRVYAVWIKEGIPPRWSYYKYRLTSLPQWLREKFETTWYLSFLYPTRVKGGGWMVEIPEDRRMGFLPAYKFFVSPWTIYNPKDADGLNNALMGDYMMGDDFDF